VKQLKGAWFLAYKDNSLVGEIGLIPFEMGSQKIERF